MKKLIFLLLFPATVLANIKLPGIIDNNMVLQRDAPVKIWGWADAGESVTVTFKNQTYTAMPDGNGKWVVTLQKSPAGGPFTMKVAGKNSITLQNILVGEVWLCSGQSNMEYKLGMLGQAYQSEIKSAENGQIRMIDLANQTAFQPMKDAKIANTWVSVNPGSTALFSAVAYFFAKNLYEKYHVPIGLISSEWGGTVAEAWTSYEALGDFPAYRQRIEELRNTQTADWQALQEKKQADWNNALLEKDAASLPWKQPDFNTTAWKTMTLPNLWESQGLPGLDGIVVFRKEIDLKPADAGKDLTLTFRVDDNDSVFFNGTFIAATQDYSKLRKYKIDAKLVKPGRNVLVIKVIDTGGGGGIYGEKSELLLQATSATLSLAGDWQYKVSVSDKDLPPNPRNLYSMPNQPTVLFNAMIAPLTDYAIKGVIWYQGESNASKAYEYRRLFPVMISDWRNRWQQGNFPFLFVQLANYMTSKKEPGESEWAELREAQSLTLSLPNTGIATIIDIGEAGDIHPKNKHDVGKRLALNAFHVAYGDKNVVYSGPVYQSMKVENDRIRLTFSNTGKGLVAKGGSLKYFAIAGADKKFVWADAKIEGNAVVVWSEKVKNPVAVRYAWADNPEGCNLYNAENLPASPFRTDDWDGITKPR